MNLSNPTLNASGCRDMTAYLAIRNIDRETKHATTAASEPVRVYICSPFAGDSEINVANALRYCRFAVEQGKLPVAPHCYFPRFMNDDDPTERELALSFGLRLLDGCGELWVFGGTISAGMKWEIAKARIKGIPIKFYTEDCEART